MKKEEYNETEEMSEEIVEENKFQEILKNKKIMIPVIVGVALLMIFFTQIIMTQIILFIRISIKENKAI